MENQLPITAIIAAKMTKLTATKKIDPSVRSQKISWFTTRSETEKQRATKVIAMFLPMSIFRRSIGELVGQRQGDDVGDDRAVERRQERDRHTGADLLGVVHVAEHRDEADQGADHAHARGRIA